MGAASFDEDGVEQSPACRCPDLELQQAPGPLCVRGTVKQRRKMGSSLCFVMLGLDTASLAKVGAAGASQSPELQLVLDHGRLQGFSDKRFRAMVSLLNVGAMVSAVGLLVSEVTRGSSLYVDSSQVELGKESGQALSIEKCDGEPATVVRIVDLCMEGVLSHAEALRAVTCIEVDEAQAREQLQRLIDLRGLGDGSAAGFRQQVLQQTRLLRGLPLEKQGRQRPPKHGAAALAVLEIAQKRVEPLWEVMPPLDANATISGRAALDSAEGRGAFDIHGSTGALSPELANAMSTRKSCGDGSRHDYATEKKIPQIRWFVASLAPLLQRVFESLPTSRPIHVVDVGGGRGDLGVAIAAASHASMPCRVTVVDINRSSLDAGAARAHALGLENIDFVCEHVAAIDNDLPPEGSFRIPPDADILVGLHCCGGLTDAFLRLVAQRRCPFMVCPCCYQHNQTLGPWCTEAWADSETRGIISRLAESTDRSVSVRAARVINTARLRALQAKVELRLSAVTFPAEYSLRNLVLMGQPK